MKTKQLKTIYSILRKGKRISRTNSLKAAKELEILGYSYVVSTVFV